MTDITKCPGYDCLIKQYCYRYTADTGQRQSVANFIFEDGDCDMFWLDEITDYEESDKVMKILRGRDLDELVEEAQERGEYE